MVDLPTFWDGGGPFSFGVAAERVKRNVEQENALRRGLLRTPNDVYSVSPRAGYRELLRNRFGQGGRGHLGSERESYVATDRIDARGEDGRLRALHRSVAPSFVLHHPCGRVRLRSRRAEGCPSTGR